jgi:serine/threonine protein kinase
LRKAGKKKVYLAHDTVLDRDVAFKLIRAEGLGAEASNRITREARAPGRLGGHPGTVIICSNHQPADAAGKHRESSASKGRVNGGFQTVRHTGARMLLSETLRK